jgi:16S rRNA (cytosine1402-N4)-methyltransferase
MPTTLEFSHQPVLLAEVLEILNIHPNGIYVDCTFGRGGHSRAILNHLGTAGRILALDLDPEAVQEALTLSQNDKRFSIIHTNFSQVKQAINHYGWLGQVDGILLDLGLSSPQVDDPKRGFSFLRDGPLDMRMNPQQGETLATWLAHATLQEVADILKTYGEERHAYRLAKAIITARDQNRLQTTRQLADTIATAHPAWEKHKHPATKAFQAFRIFLNRELEELQQVLPQILDILAPAGRLAVISFHSLEDRIVKRFIRDCVRGDDFPPDLPVKAEALHPKLRAIGKPIYPSVAEIAANPRARSAILRVAERI